ncbi:IRK-interacting protein-like [Tasmannia lanceolata]|uniref:IRK-interacting protein-like n=1 Tax=Tasmannia lanceolata TaxID=3420 RepID=UPI00406441E3
MASSSSSSKGTAPSPRPLVFPTIPESEKEDEDEDDAAKTPVQKTTPYKHHPTPLHVSSSHRRPESEPDDRTVSCNKCRPSGRDKKISVVPLDINGPKSPNPSNIFKSLFTKKSPKSPAPNFSSSSSPARKEEKWKLAVSELSHKLLEATRKRDEALLEASRLKNSMSELENKLNKLEVYCHELKSGLEKYKGNSNSNSNSQEKIVNHFLLSVSDARTSVRHLSRSLTLQLRQMNGKVYEKISSLLQHYEIQFSVSQNHRNLLFYLEALLNKTFYEDFEMGCQKNGSDPILNPIERSEANFESYMVLKEVTWEEVLIKGTKYFSEDFSGFCDKKMSEIVGMLSWNRAWPEPVLRAFFGAAKCVFLVRLLAGAVYPSIPIFRVEKGVRFEGAYMEDMVGDKSGKLVPSVVRVMVAPGFYVYSYVVKCKVLCRYTQFPIEK